MTQEPSPPSTQQRKDAIIESINRGDDMDATGSLMLLDIPTLIEVERDIYDSLDDARKD